MPHLLSRRKFLLIVSRLFLPKQPLFFTSNQKLQSN